MYYLKFCMSSVQIFDQSYTRAHFQFIVQLDVLFCTRSKNIMTYMSTFRIFVHIHTIFMHNVDFKSDTYLVLYLKFDLVKYKDLVQSYTWTHFQFIVQLNVLFAISIKINDIFITFRIFVYLYTIFMHNVDFKSDPYTLCNIWNFPRQVYRFSYNLIFGHIFSS